MKPLAQHPEIEEYENGESHTLCPKPIPDDSSGVGDIQDGVPGLLVVICSSSEGRNMLASVDTDAALSGLPLTGGLMKPAQGMS